MVSDEQEQQAAGLRFELRLRSAEAHAASYEATLSSQGSQWVGDVDLIPPTGEVVFRFEGSEAPPAACLAIVRAAARAIYRDHEKAGFPRRITRWRPLPTSPSEP
ncbi:MAG: hypothetical protein QM756_23400 [Polyangiaceae bacterium]